MTDRLYYNDCYLRDFRARIVETSEGGRRVYLDRTAFYPTSGGQRNDTGFIGGARVVDVIDEDDRVAHILESPLPAGEAAANKVEAHIDWPRRFDHMQQHTGQHLLSAVLEELFHYRTLSFHMGADLSTIEIGTPMLDAGQIERAEERCAEMVSEARPVSMTYEDASTDLGLRKASEREGTLRIISIHDFDRSACGGTHVRSTSEIGPIFIRKTEKIRGNARLEFVCGLRALRHARSDFRALQEIARQLSVSPERTPELVAGQMERIKSLEKSAQKLAIELAQREGRELWAAAQPGQDGLRRLTQTGAIDDTMRTRAQAFVGQGKAVFLAICEDPPSLLLACSADSGIHAGERIKAAMTAAGGRGGGNQAIAQGSIPGGSLMTIAVLAERLIH